MRGVQGSTALPPAARRAWSFGITPGDPAEQPCSTGPKLRGDLASPQRRQIRDQVEELGAAHLLLLPLGHQRDLLHLARFDVRLVELHLALAVEDAQRLAV